MSKIEHIQTEIQKLNLSPKELEEVREWLEDFLEDQLEFTDEFKAKIEESERDRAAGRYARIRKPGHDS